MKFVSTIILTLIFSFNSFGLEVDEKLTIRLIRTSESKKTVMINRGVEDGLAEGDHAKFIVTAGIVARAVCIKVSPTRSIWSIYRLVNADFVVNESVMTLKITPPVKITKDESKSLIQEDIPDNTGTKDANQIGIPLAEGADDLEKEGATSEDPDLKALNSDTPVIIPEKNREVFGLVSLSALSANTKTSTGSDSFTNSQGHYQVGLGAEIYSQNERKWYSRFSLLGSVNLIKMSNQAYNGSGSSNQLTEFSLGTNWHFSKLPSVTMSLIPFIHLDFNFGTIKSSYSAGTESNGEVESLSASGSTQGYSIGFGYKFYFPNGFGARVLLNYYSRSETYSEDDQTNKFNKTVSGPQLHVGLGYKF